MTPDEMLAAHARAAAENGKQVLLDKPMGLTLEECDAVIEASERTGVRVIVGHSQSLDPPNLKMAEIANSGRLGKQVMIHTLFYSDWIYRPRQREELMQDHGGSIVRRQGRSDLPAHLCRRPPHILIPTHPAARLPHR